MEQLIMQGDVVNLNGRLYPKEELAKAAELFNQRQLPMLGELKAVRDSSGYGIINVEDVSHQVSRLWMDGDKLMGEIKCLATPKGKVLEAMLEVTPVAFRSFGRGNIDKDGVVTDYQIDGVGVYHPDEVA